MGFKHNPFRVDLCASLPQGWLQKAQPTLGFDTLPLRGSFETLSPALPAGFSFGIANPAG